MRYLAMTALLALAGCYAGPQDDTDRSAWIGLIGQGASMMAQPSYQSRPWTASCTRMGNFTNCYGD